MRKQGVYTKFCNLLQFREQHGEKIDMARNAKEYVIQECAQVE